MSEPKDIKNKNELMERVVIAGDLAKLDAKDRVAYYMAVCESVGLNPYTKPFELITLNGKMVMYATRTATDQLRQVNKVSVTLTSKVRENGVYIVTAAAKTADGRSDESTGVVHVEGLKGDMLANSYMKAETKAKRRVTLSIVGLGWMDESEIETIPHAQKHTIDIKPEAVQSTPPPTPPQAALSSDDFNSFKDAPWRFEQNDADALNKMIEDAGSKYNDVLAWCQLNFPGLITFSDFTSQQFAQVVEMLKVKIEKKRK